MSQVRYFGVLVGEVGEEAGRADARMGRFFPLPDPLPVGTTVEIDGQSHRVTRVDEGMTPGFWVLPAGAPRVVDAEITAPSPPPAVAAPTEPIDTEDTAPKTVEMTAVDEQAFEAQAAAPRSDSSPELDAAERDGAEPPAEPEAGGGGKSKRRRRGKSKTQTGR